MPPLSEYPHNVLLKRMSLHTPAGTDITSAKVASCTSAVARAWVGTSSVGMIAGVAAAMAAALANATPLFMNGRD